MAQQAKTVTLLLVGIFMTAFGVKLLSAGTLTFGGTAGVAFLLSYVSPYPWAFWFLIVNLPFFWLSYRVLGSRFTLSTFLSIVGTSLAQQGLDTIMDAPAPMHPMAAAVASGMLIGIGISFVLNNGSSLGGVQIFALVLDRKFRINRGTTIFVSDALIVLTAAWLLGWNEAVASIVSIAVASYIIGRYRRAPVPLPDRASPSIIQASGEDRTEADPENACASRTNERSV